MSAPAADASRRLFESWSAGRWHRAVCLWQVPGPPDTAVAAIECWQVPNGDVVDLRILELYADGNGFEIFAPIKPEPRS